MKFIDDKFEYGSSYGNDILYKMCKEKPLHENIDIIQSKIWLIGRSYSAALERTRGKIFDPNTYAQKILDSEIDVKIKELKEIEYPSIKNVETILSAHKYVTDLFQEITGLYKRSLASKYLHFHAPKAVFIYDSIAKREVRKNLNNTKQCKLTITHKYDNEYTSFVCHCLKYREILEKELNGHITPRRLDLRLLGLDK